MKQDPGPRKEVAHRNQSPRVPPNGARVSRESGAAALPRTIYCGLAAESLIRLGSATRIPSLGFVTVIRIDPITELAFYPSLGY